MNLRWKLYQIINYILLIISAIFVVFCIILYANDNDNQDLSGIGAVFTCFCFLFCNNLINLFLLKKYFPDKIMNIGARTLHLSSTVAALLLAAGLTFMSIFTFIQEFLTASNDDIGKIMVMIVIAITIMHIYSVIYQLKFIGVLRRNYENSMTSLIDSIGRND